jgi:VWFA-related protein
VHFVTLVVDLADTVPSDMSAVRAAATSYVQRVLASDDFVAVYYVDHSLHLALPFTRDRQAAADALLRITSRTTAGGLTAAERQETQAEINNLIASGMGIEAAAAMPDISKVKDPAILRQVRSLQGFLWSQSTFQAKEIFVALRAIAQAYSGLPGRKNVVLISGGFIHSPDARPQMEAVIDAANRANVAFYAVDTSGLQAGFGAEGGVMSLNSNQELFMAAQMAGMVGPNGEFAWAERIAAEGLQNDLGQLALATGGFGIKNQNDLYHALRLVDSDLREFYTLVYQPHITSYDGSFHKIRVELKRAGYRLRYRKGYWAIPAGQEAVMTPAAAQLINDVRSGALKARLAASVAAVELIAPDGTTALPVRVSFPGSSIRFTRNRNLYESNITLVLLAEQGTLAPLSVYQRFIDLRLNKSQWSDFTKKPVDINARLSIPALVPVHVQAIARFADGTVASGERSLEISAASTGGLQISSLLLSDRIVPAEGKPDPSDPLRGPNYQLFIPKHNDFPSSDQLTLYFSVSGIAPGTKVLDVEFLLRSRSRVIRRLGRETIDSPKGSALVLRQFALNGLEPGHYSVVVNVSSAMSVEQQGMTSTSTDFTVS